MTVSSSPSPSELSIEESKDIEKLGEQQDRESLEDTSNDIESENEPQELRTISKSKSRDSAHQIIVKWDSNDPDNPFRWSEKYRWFITAQLGLLALAASLGSSITAPANAIIGEYVGVSQEVSVLTVSLYVLGFCIGPLMWAPLSEVFGRRVSMLPAMMGLGIFSIGCAVSKNATSIFICRFFSGIFGSAPVSNVSAALGDIWEPRQRGIAVTFYAVAVVGGPTLGPTIGAALTVNKHLGWRWTEYILAIWTFATTIFCYFFFPEVYGPYLLKKRAQKLRKETGDPRYHHPHEDVKIDFRSVVTKHLTRPVRMLLTEPMVTAIAIYASFVFALLYMTLEFFSIVYHENRGWPLVTSTLPFVGLFVGVVSAVGVNLANQPHYQRAVAANNGKPVPEARLPPMAIGGVIFAIGLFMFGWTASPGIPWPPSVIAAGFIGAGFNIIFQQCINFLVDTYRLYAASAVSANTFLRSLMAAGLPLAARPMFMNLGVGPAMSILGGIAVLAIPVPFLFMKFGKRLRRMSKFAPVDD